MTPRLTGDPGPRGSDFAGLPFWAGDFFTGQMGGGSAIVEADRLTADRPLLPSKPVLAVVIIAGPCAPRPAAVLAPVHRRGEVLLGDVAPAFDLAFRSVALVVVVDPLSSVDSGGNSSSPGPSAPTSTHNGCLARRAIGGEGGNFFFFQLLRVCCQPKINLSLSLPTKYPPIPEDSSSLFLFATFSRN
jgi:hypothetical protein